MAIPNGYVKIEPNRLYELVEYYIDTTIPPTEITSNIADSDPTLYPRITSWRGTSYPDLDIYDEASLPLTQEGVTTEWNSDIVDGVITINGETIYTDDGMNIDFSKVYINLTTSPDWLYVKAPESKYKAVELYEETELQESAELTIEANTTTTLQLEEGKVAVKSVTITTRVTSGLVTIVQRPEPPTDALKSKLYVENSIYWVGEPTDDATPFIKYIKASDFAGVFANDNYHYLKFEFPTATYYYDFNGYYKGSVGWYKGNEQWVYNSDDLIFNSAMMNTSNDLSYLYTIVGTPDIDLQEGKSVLITQNGVSLVTPDIGYDAFKSLAVSVQVPDVIPEGYIKPAGTLEITENGDYDVTEKASVKVNITSSGGNTGGAAVYEASTDAEMTSYANSAYDGAFVKFTGTTGTYVKGRIYKIEREAPYKFTVTSISSDCSILAEDGTVITAGQRGEFYSPTRTLQCSGAYSSHSLSGTNVEILGTAGQIYSGIGKIILLNNEATVSFTGTNSSGGAN